MSKWVGFIDFWADVKDYVKLSCHSKNVALPTLEVAPGEALKIMRTQPLLKFRAVNTNRKRNESKGAQSIQFRSSTDADWSDAIPLEDGMIHLPGHFPDTIDECPGWFVFSPLLTGLVGTILTRWKNARAQRNSIELFDVQVGVRVFFEREEGV